MTLIDQIRDLIAAGETEKSLKELYTYVKENNADVIDNLVMLQNRMQTMQRAVSLGTMDDRSAALERAKINEAILKLLPQLTPEYLSQASIRREPVYQAAPPQAAPAPNKNRLYLIGGGILLVLILIFALSQGGSPEGETNPVGETTVAEPASTAEPANTAGSGLTAPEGSLLAKVLSEHAGYALWKSDYSSANGQSLFRLESNNACEEIKNDVVIGRWEIYENSADYVTLYSSSKKMYVRIAEHDAQFQMEGEAEWNEMFPSGTWITPPDAPQN